MTNPSSDRPPQVFLSYRRRDTLAVAGRIYDKLTNRLGSENVFMDFDTIPLGMDFRKHLRESLNRCDVLLVLIGPNWVGRGADGDNPRIQDPDDFVRIEVEIALGREDIPVIPVLVGNTPMPAAETLPAELRPLVYRQAATVDLGPDFHVHMDRLIEALWKLAPKSSAVEEEEVQEALEKAGLEEDETTTTPSHRDPTGPAETDVETRSGPGAIRHLLSFSHGRWKTRSLAWAGVGAISGALSLGAISRYSIWNPPLYEQILPLSPGIIFGAALCAFEDIASDGVIRRWSRAVSRPLLVIGSCAAWMVAGFVPVFLSDPLPVLLVGVVAGGVGGVLLAALLLTLWNIGAGRRRWAAWLAGTGAVLAAPVATGLEEGIFLVLVPWQAGLFAVIALLPVLADIDTESGSAPAFIRRLRRLWPSHSVRQKIIPALSGNQKAVILTGFVVIVAGVLAFTMVGSDSPNRSGSPTASELPRTLRAVRCTRWPKGSTQGSSPSDDTKTGTISGEVLTDEGLSPAGIQVFLPEGQKGTIVSENGQFRISGVPVGRHTLRARSSLFGSAECEITVGTEGSARAIFSLGQRSARR